MVMVFRVFILGFVRSTDRTRRPKAGVERLRWMKNDRRSLHVLGHKDRKQANHERIKAELAG